MHERATHIWNVYIYTYTYTRSEERKGQKNYLCALSLLLSSFSFLIRWSNRDQSMYSLLPLNHFVFGEIQVKHFTIKHNKFNSSSSEDISLFLRIYNQIFYRHIIYLYSKLSLTNWLYFTLRTNVQLISLLFIIKNIVFWWANSRSERN